MRYILSLILFLIFSGSSNAQSKPCSVELPVVFQNGLIYLKLPCGYGDTLQFYLDTGGKNYLYRSGRKKLDGPFLKKSRLEEYLIEKFDEQGLQMGLDLNFDLVKYNDGIEDGMLGREWFSQGIWVFDYANEQLWYHKTDCDLEGGEFESELFFKKEDSGEFSSGLGRVEVEIDGVQLSLLMDTGAQVNLSKSTQKQLAKPPLIATSFINASVFDAWRSKHPDWIVIEDADLSYGMNEDMIMVPELKIEGEVVGPVAFVRREDSNFEIMSELFMDEPIVGALGANCLSLFGRCSVDFINEKIRFHEPVR